MFTKTLIMVGTFILIDYNLNLSEEHFMGGLILMAFATGLDLLWGKVK